MKSRIPFDRVNWEVSIFLITTFLVAVIGTPLYIANFGIDWVLTTMFFGGFFITGISITLGYHRLFAHRAFKAKWPVRLTTLLFGACAFEDSALDWASDHREHHKHVDEDEDPYDISKGFFWAHIGWIFFKLYPRPLHNVNDLKKDELVMWQHRHHRAIAMLMGLGGPTVVGLMYNGWEGALGGFLIGGVARVVAVQHCTFFINSLCHTMGNRPYDSRTSARDSFFMALLTFGEGYHNYHHSFQHDYRNGVKGHQFDPTKWSISILSKLGLVTDLRRVSPEKIMLAELRETRRLAEVQLAEIAESQCPDSEPCPKWKLAMANFEERFGSLKESFVELEEAISSGVEVSRDILARYKSESVQVLEHLSEVSKMHLKSVAVSA